MMIKKWIENGFINRLGSIAAFTAAILFRRNLSAEYSLLCTAGILQGPVPHPDSVQVLLHLFQDSSFLGLLHVGFFDLVNFLLVGLIFFPIIFLVFKSKKTVAAAAAGICTTSGLLFNLAMNPALAFLFLGEVSDYSQSGEDEVLINIGHYLMANYRLNTFENAGLYPSFLLVSIAGLILAFWMWNSGWFSRSASLAGILANLTGLSYYFVRVFSPDLIFLPLSISALFLLAWYLMIWQQLKSFERQNHLTQVEEKILVNRSLK